MFKHTPAIMLPECLRACGDAACTIAAKNKEKKVNPQNTLIALAVVFVMAAALPGAAMAAAKSGA